MLTRFLAGMVLLLSLGGVADSSARVPDAGLVGPTVPCYKCENYGTIMNPNSRCVMVDTDAIFDLGYTHCTTYGGGGGVTSCQTSGEVCVWSNPWLSTNGSGVPGTGIGVLAAGADPVRNCEGAIIARSIHVAAKSELGTMLL
jgi:hypothetical protein